MFSRAAFLAVAVACAGACGGRPSGERLAPAAGTEHEAALDPESAEPEAPPRVAADPTPAPMVPILEAHNRARAAHCAPPLVWSEELEATAQRWADRLASRCTLEHSGGTIGENLSMATEGALDADGVVELWYREHAHYDFRRGGFSMETGHFTQVVWVGSRALGCASARCRGLDVWVCNYDPPGNVQGEYQANVLPTSCR